MYYYPLEPPYILLVIGFLTALTSGFALSGSLKLIVQRWESDSTDNTRQLLIPFIGITGGISLFLPSGLEIFGFPSTLALGIGLPLSLLTCLLIWFQLGSLLDFARRRGLQSLDLDS